MKKDLSRAKGAGGKREGRGRRTAKDERDNFECIREEKGELK